MLPTSNCSGVRVNVKKSMENQTIFLILHTQRDQNYRILFFGIVGIYLHTLTSLLLPPPFFFFFETRVAAALPILGLLKKTKHLKKKKKKREKGETRKIATATNHIRHYHYLCIFVCIFVYVCRIKLMPCYKIVTELYKHILFFFFFFFFSSQYTGTNLQGPYGLCQYIRFGQV